MTASPTRYVRATRADVVFNSLVRWLTKHGVSLMGSRVLIVRGRKTGTPQSVQTYATRITRSGLSPSCTMRCQISRLIRSHNRSPWLAAAAACSAASRPRLTST